MHEIKEESIVVQVLLVSSKRKVQSQDGSTFSTLITDSCFGLEKVLRLMVIKRVIFNFAVVNCLD